MGRPRKTTPIPLPPTWSKTRDPNALCIYCEEKPQFCRGLCVAHYNLWKRHNRKPNPDYFYGLWETRKRASGYVEVKTPMGWVLEHRHVMSVVLGRELLPGENVHHINGDRADNRQDNLELWVTMQPAGQRPKDLVDYAREILRRYDSETW